MRKISITIVICFLTTFNPTVLFANLDGVALGQLTTAVTEMCETPTKKGDRFSVSGTVSGGAKLKIFDAGVDVQINKEEWNGIQQIREHQPSRVECVVKLVTILTPLFAASSQKPKCEEPLSWDKTLRKCMKIVDVPRKIFSIPLDRSISNVMGTIHFRLNKERHDFDNKYVQHKNNNGAIQVDIPVMLNKTLVGRATEVIYDDRDGIVCSIDDLTETTGWSKKIGSSYLMYLHDCGIGERKCSANIRSNSNKRVDVRIERLRVHISVDGNCSPN